MKRRRRVVTGAGAALLLPFVLGACGGDSTVTPVPEGATVRPYALTVDDRSSWGTLAVAIGDAVVAHVSCDESVTITLGDPNVPPLPWTVRLTTSAGQTVDQRVETGLAGPMWLLVFDTQVEEGTSPALGPAPPCAFPSPSIEPLPTAGITDVAAVDLGSRILAPRSAGPIAIETATIARLAVYTAVDGVDPHTPVWAVTFSGAFADPSGCVAPPQATPCPRQPDALVLLDFATGATLAVIVPARR